MTDVDWGMDRPKQRGWRRKLGWLAGGAAVLGACILARAVWGPPPASAAKKPAAAKASQPQAASAEKPDVVAVVNAQPVTRNDLARECLRLYGEEVLEHLVNKHLILQECKKRNLGVTKEEVQEEIHRSAQRFGLPTDQWLKMLKEERGINPQQYAADIIWPMIALRKLAAERLEVTPQEIQQAYETFYGPSVQTRLIACGSPQEAERVRALALADPDSFGDLAKQYSNDTGSASAKGLIQPIRKHVGDPNIERAAFSLRPGDISEVIQVGDQHVILKCESELPARKMPMAQVEKVLADSIRDKKMRLAADDIFGALQKGSRVENVFNDPARRQEYPGVAALINGQKMSIRELAEECIDRHGQAVLDDIIKRRLLEQACQKRKIEVSEQDLQEEIARAAVAMGKPDIAAWLEEVNQVQGLSLETYRHDVVWPTAALKKLVDGNVEISEEDLRKGYEANYGPRARCRAIVLSQLRRAQEVWAMARQNPSVEYFGDLAEQYSVETASRTLRGEVPPIQRHGGQPLLEREAFALQPGELSGVIQVGDKYVILLSEGLTQPVDVAFDDVKRLLYEDLHEKKLRLAMAAEFTRLEESAQIDNYLAGTSKAPAGPAAGIAGRPRAAASPSARTAAQPRPAAARQ